jgi:ABC-type xylose transport system permease subunit
MASVRQIWRAGRIALFTLAGLLIWHGAALAQPPGTKAAPIAGEGINSGVYVMAYFLVIFAIALGMLFVCRSSNRRERARPEQFEAKNLKEEDQ